MEWKASEIAALVKGTVEGDPNVIVTEPSKIEESKPGSITFLANAKYEHYLYESQASIALVSKDFLPEKALSMTLIRVDQVYPALQQLLEVYQQQHTVPDGVDPGLTSIPALFLILRYPLGPALLSRKGLKSEREQSSTGKFLLAARS